MNGQIFHFLIVFSSVFGIVFACPDQCICSTVTDPNGVAGGRVDCSNRQFSAIPPASGFDDNIHELDMSANQMTRLDVLDTFSELRSLKLAVNRIEELGPKAFDSVPKITALDLSNNLLTELHDSIFDALRDLKVLNISNNKIQILPPNLFTNTIWLVELHLSGNPLKDTIEPSFFNPTKNLRQVTGLVNQETDCDILHAYILYNMNLRLKWLKINFKE